MHSPITSSSSAQIHTIKGFSKAIITCTGPSCCLGNILVLQWSKINVHQSHKVKTDQFGSDIFRPDDSLCLVICNAAVWEGEKEMKRKGVGCVVHVIWLPTSEGFLTSFLIKGSVSLCLKFSGRAKEQDWNQMAPGKHLVFCFKDIVMKRGKIWKKTLLFVRREI